MQTLIKNKEKILEIKKKVEEKDTSLYNHLEIQNIPINEETISIVMTASNRSKQTYFTLKTIQNSMHKAVQVIIVDDSNTDPIVKEELEKYPFYIDFITIKKENKNWVNPVVNYNIGFQYIKGTKIIIQNAEVCHIGDVLSYMNLQMIPEHYYICDVRSSNSIATNEIIYQYNTNNTDIYNNHELFNMWYQGRERIVNYHFLSAMTIDTFNKIKNFSYDYTMGISFDDDDFLLKIIANKIKIINLFYDEFNLGGIHLWHSSNIKKIRKKIETNQNIFNKKKQNYEETGEYIEIINNIPENRKDEKLNIELNNKLDLLELQKLILQLEGEKSINFYINKKNISYSINSFRKCYLKGYCYKNSGLKIPKNLNIKFYYI
jgi:hypothetical protein